MADNTPTVGVIGGTGLYMMDGLDAISTMEVSTPFGAPSGQLTIGRMGDTKVVFLPRHGEGHTLSPSEVPYRANICALKMLGVSKIFSVSAVGSMREEVPLGVPVLVDQFIDRTNLRRSTFFEDGVVAHVSMANPTCPSLRGLLMDAARALNMVVVPRGTYVCIEGPQFSSRAESEMYRQVGVDVIGMTNATEAKLAREAEICYATIALPTDYDCWHTRHEAVSVESVLKNLEQGTEKAKKLIVHAIRHLPDAHACDCGKALERAIITDLSRAPLATLERLEPIAGKYL